MKGQNFSPKRKIGLLGRKEGGQLNNLMKGEELQGMQTNQKGEGSK